MVKKSKIKLVSVPAVETPVGTTLAVPEAAVSTITQAEQRVLETQLILGQRTEEYESVRNQLLHALQEARQAYVAQITSISKELGIKIEQERWEFQRNTLTFVRIE